MAEEILKELSKLESLAGPSNTSKSKSRSASGPSLSTTLEQLEEAFARAKTAIERGDNAAVALEFLQRSVDSKKGDADRGVKDWYGALGRVGKALDKKFPHQLCALSQTYDLPTPLFSSPESSQALDQIIMNSMIRQGAWEAVEAFKGESKAECDEEAKRLSVVLHGIVGDLMNGDVDSALQWATKHHAYLASPPHPSPLPFYLHRSRFISLLRSHPLSPGNEGIPPSLQYARDHFIPYIPNHSTEIFRLTASLIYPRALASNKDEDNLAPTPYADLFTDEMEAKALISLFRTEYCRLHGWPKEDPLEVVVELGSNGALGKIEKARNVMEARLGPLRTWDTYPMELPLPPSRQYHSVFACPVSKEQATEDNPPKMLLCGHVIAQDSLTKLSKHGRRAIKCPYCPVETGIASATRLYF